MGQVEIGINCYLTADILTTILQKYSLGGPQPNLWILFKQLNVTGCRGNRKAKFAKKTFKNRLFRSHKVDEAETLQKYLQH